MTYNPFIILSMDHDPIYNIKNEDTFTIMCLFIPRIPKTTYAGNLQANKKNNKENTCQPTICRNM